MQRHQTTPAPRQPLKVSPIKALQNIIANQSSGSLTLSDPNNPLIGWRVYFSNSQIHFAESTIGQQERLRYLLRGYISEQELIWRQQFNSDYAFLCHLWKSDRLSLSRFRQLLSMLTQEALIRVLAIPQVHLQLEPNVGLELVRLSFHLQQLILPVRAKISEWAFVRSKVGSPFHKIVIKDSKQLAKLLWLVSKNCPHPQHLIKSLGKNLCLYQIASQLEMDIDDLAIALQPLIKHGAIGVNLDRSLEGPTTPPIVASVDDSKTIQQFVKIALQPAGYEVLSLLDPTEALTNLLKHPPILILMDVEMPKIDGYELCRMLRQQKQLSNIPIVMLTGRHRTIDRVRARKAGANAYLTKPFQVQELVNLVQQLTTTSTLNGHGNKFANANGLG